MDVQYENCHKLKSSSFIVFNQKNRMMIEDKMEILKISEWLFPIAHILLGYNLS